MTTTTAKTPALRQLAEMVGLAEIPAAQAAQAVRTAVPVGIPVALAEARRLVRVLNSGFLWFFIRNYGSKSRYDAADALRGARCVVCI
jgi:hypothetical protein